jgi:hypothetical protein
VTSSRPQSLRELNRTLLARQLLLERKRLPVARAVSRLVALQAQYAPSPYVALWSRLEGFRKEQLTSSRAVVKAGSLRGTLHVMARADFPAIISGVIGTQPAPRHARRAELLAALPDELLTTADYFEIGHRVLDTDDRWQVAFALRTIPTVRVGVVGAWPHNKPSPSVIWRELLPDAADAAARVVRAYVAAYGPATRNDVQQFTGYRLGLIDSALDGLTECDGFYDVPRGLRVAGDLPAPVRFLPAFDSVILAHRDRARIVPPEYVEVVFNKKNATTKNVFTVDGFVAGAWRVDGTRMRVEPFAPLPAKWRREVDGEGERLLAWWLDRE